MEKKSVSASLLIFYLTGLFAVVGSCFYTFVFKERQIKVEKVIVTANSQIKLYDNEEKTQETIELKLSNMEQGIRPATGKLNQETQIPSTINDEGTSEGYYATVYVDTTVNYKIMVKNIKIDSTKAELEVKEERKNIFLAIKDIQNTTKTLEKDEFEIVKFENISDIQKLTFFIWIGALTDDVLQGAKISFELSFEAI